jgi:hypothetical protein
MSEIEWIILGILWQVLISNGETIKITSVLFNYSNNPSQLQDFSANFRIGSKMSDDFNESNFLMDFVDAGFLMVDIFRIKIARKRWKFGGAWKSRPGFAQRFH